MSHAWICCLITNLFFTKIGTWYVQYRWTNYSKILNDLNY